MLIWFTISNNWMDEIIKWLPQKTQDILSQHWAANGYVAVSKEYKCYWCDYNDLCWHQEDVECPLKDYEEISVHWWLTFGDSLETCKTQYKHIYNAYLEQPGTSKDDDVWIFGFDTRHHGDTQIEWPIERVEAEVNSLKEQMVQFLK